MSIRHHINDDILLAYAAGDLAEGWSLLVATHLALCPQCRHFVRDAEAIGGALFDDVEEIAVDDDAFARTMARVDATASTSAKKSIASPERPVLPEPLRSYLGGDARDLTWKQLGRGAYHIPIRTADGRTRARLLRIPAGAPVPEHGHNGLELTLVMSGCFADKTGGYGRGDVQEADAELEHQPIAGSDEDCICLAVTDAPLRFKSWAARFVQPFLGI